MDRRGQLIEVIPLRDALRLLARQRGQYETVTAFLDALGMRNSLYTRRHCLRRLITAGYVRFDSRLTPRLTSDESMVVMTVLGWRAFRSHFLRDPTYMAPGLPAAEMESILRGHWPRHTGA